MDEYGVSVEATFSRGANQGKAQLLLWNEAQQLAEIKDEARSQQTIARYDYDASGNRVKKMQISSNQTTAATTATSITTHYVYDNRHRLIAQADDKGQVQRQSLYTDHTVSHCA
jgi:YD repeat-containing protein